jgi:hypothetical protein
MSRDQKYHGKVKAVIDSLRDAGVKLLWGKLNAAKLNCHVTVFWIWDFSFVVTNCSSWYCYCYKVELSGRIMQHGP